MNREEQIGAGTIGHCRALLERDEDVGAARHDHLDARLVLQQLLEPQRDVEHDLGLRRVAHAGDAWVMAAVARVDDDA